MGNKTMIGRKLTQSCVNPGNGCPGPRSNGSFISNQTKLQATPKTAKTSVWANLFFIQIEMDNAARQCSRSKPPNVQAETRRAKDSGKKETFPINPDVQPALSPAIC